MPVNSQAVRPHQKTVPPGSGDNAHCATDAPRTVILIGAGRRGLNVHLPAVDACACLRLTGIVDVKERIAQLTEIPALTVPIHDSLDSALAGPRPGLAIVATPHDSHVPLAEALLRAGVPTLLEKPPARSAPELATLLRLSRKLRTPLATSLPLHHRYQGFIRLLRSPELTGAEVSIRADVSCWPGTESWRLSRERAGGGVLIDLGYHYLELLVACLGPPDGKLALLTRAADGRGEVEDEAQVSLWFAARGLQVQLHLRSGTELARTADLAIRRSGTLLYHSSDGGPAGPVTELERSAGPPPPAAAAAQLEALMISGFLDGRGGWYQELLRQHAVMLLIDDLYAGAEHVACSPPVAARAGHELCPAGPAVPDLASLAHLTGLPERTPV
jgi:predicted dehydrogenase